MIFGVRTALVFGFVSVFVSQNRRGSVKRAGLRERLRELGLRVLFLYQNCRVCTRNWSGGSNGFDLGFYMGQRWL